jgi:hypothetical protein
MDVSKNKQLPFAHSLRRSRYSRLAGYGDLNDATRLAKDPIFKVDWLEEDLGRWHGADLALAVVRNDAAHADRRLPGIADPPD